MTVSSSPSPLSRAGSLTLLGGDIALDFANTESGRGSSSHQNHFREPNNVLDWLAHAKALPVEDIGFLRGETAAKPALGAELLARALGLRDALHGVADAVGRRDSIPPAALADLSARHALSIRHATLVADNGACRWRWSARHAPVEAALGPIALAAVRLFTEGDLARVKQCQGHACGWVFYDTTKNNRRRWCEMEVCGNRAKQKRLAARRRGG